MWQENTKYLPQTHICDKIKQFWQKIRKQYKLFMFKWTNSSKLTVVRGGRFSTKQSITTSWSRVALIYLSENVCGSVTVIITVGAWP